MQKARKSTSVTPEVELFREIRNITNERVTEEMSTEKNNVLAYRKVERESINNFSIDNPESFRDRKIEYLIKGINIGTAYSFRNKEDNIFFDFYFLKNFGYSVALILENQASLDLNTKLFYNPKKIKRAPFVKNPLAEPQSHCRHNPHYTTGLSSRLSYLQYP